jgi:hypothetical protein
LKVRWRSVRLLFDENVDRRGMVFIDETGTEANRTRIRERAPRGERLPGTEHPRGDRIEGLSQPSRYV